ncbi:MAG: flagellar M-ring protein FliF [Rubellimicrobium sp.]|nr:flagellar M-ring protein FliF [Rubellimicrobium sp.]
MWGLRGESCPGCGESALNIPATLWSALAPRRKIVVVAATLAVLAAVIALGRAAGGRDMALLYAGLEPGAAGGVIAALEQRGIGYDVRGDAIFVPRDTRDVLRLSLAGEGLPASTAQGYELLDSLTGFGTTSQMFDAAYWRAKEGELARTILAVPGVRAARVHISSPGNRPFARDVQRAASVTVTMAGAPLPPSQARALRWLVASAVAGMAAADVAVIDTATGLVLTEDSPGTGDTMADGLRLRALHLVEARVGIGNAVVEVTVERVSESESITERRIDPDSRTAISSETEERQNTTQGGGEGAVSVASNLPDGDAGAAAPGPHSAETSTRALTNYELSQTSREIVREPGDVRRLSVAVLVNDAVTQAADGSRATTPRPPEELQALGDLVASAVGFDAARGDVVTIRSMPFEPLVAQGSEGVAAAGGLDRMGLIRLAALVLVALVLGLFVLRPILAPARRQAAIGLPPPGPALPAVAGAGDDPAWEPMIAPMDLGGFGAADTAEDAEVVDPVTRLRRLIESRQEETIQILHDWMDGPSPGGQP